MKGQSLIKALFNFYSLNEVQVNPDYLLLKIHKSKENYFPMYPLNNADRILYNASRATGILTSMRWPRRLRRFRVSLIWWWDCHLRPVFLTSRSKNLSKMCVENGPCWGYHRTCLSSPMDCWRSATTLPAILVMSVSSTVPSSQSNHRIIQCLPSWQLPRTNQ